MTQDRFRQKLASGETAYGLDVKWPSPEIVEYFGYLGFDWAFIDAQHGTIGRESCVAMVRACEISGMTPLVRVPDNNPATILGYLETGAAGIIVPHVSTADDAKRAVDAMRFYPHGTRGAFSAPRQSHYGLRESKSDYFRRANEEVLVYIQIEDPEGLKNLDEILAVEGVDVVDLGPGDIAMTLGFPGQGNHPTVKAAIQDAWDRIAAARPNQKLDIVGVTELLEKAGRDHLNGNN